MVLNFSSPEKKARRTSRHRHNPLPSRTHAGDSRKTRKWPRSPLASPTLARVKLDRQKRLRSRSGLISWGKYSWYGDNCGTHNKRARSTSPTQGRAGRNSHKRLKSQSRSASSGKDSYKRDRYARYFINRWIFWLCPNIARKVCLNNGTPWMYEKWISGKCVHIMLKFPKKKIMYTAIILFVVFLVILNVFLSSK